jgi:serine/threonine-protein kinase RIO1
LKLHDFESSICDGYYIKRVLFHVKSGKEADVYCCEAYPHVGPALLAAKVYRPLETRGFRNDSLYQEGRFIKDRRLRKAFQGRSKAGRSVQFGMWVSAEYETMRRLYEAGAHVPKPYAQSVDPEENASAFRLLDRDIRNVVDYFSKYGVKASAHELAHGMWEKHIHWGFVLDQERGS